MDNKFKNNNEILNYTDFRESINGMISKRDIVLENCDKFFLVKRNRKKIILLPKDIKEQINIKDLTKYKETIGRHERLCIQYFPEEMYDKSFKQEAKINNIEIKNKFKLTSLISYISPNFFDLKGKNYIELRETRNNIIKNNKVYIKNELIDVKEINNLIDEWNTSCGVKYRRTNHSGYDKNFFNNFYDPEKYYGSFFYETQNNKLIGYSIISKQSKPLNDIECYSYLLRKCLSETNNIRNLSLFIDYMSFVDLSQKRKENYENKDKGFYIHWGASKGNLLKYKKKFPIYSEDKIMFFMLNTMDLFKNVK